MMNAEVVVYIVTTGL